MSMLVTSWIKNKTGVVIPEQVAKTDPLLSSAHTPGYDEVPIIIANIPTVGFRCVYTKAYEDLIVPESAPHPGKTRIDNSLELLKKEDLVEAILWCLPKERHVYCLPSVYSHRSYFLKILRNAIYRFSKNHDAKHPLLWIGNALYHDYDWNDEFLASVIKDEATAWEKIYKISEAVSQPSLDYAISSVLKEALLYG